MAPGIAKALQIVAVVLAFFGALFMGAQDTAGIIARVEGALRKWETLPHRWFEKMIAFEDEHGNWAARIMICLMMLPALICGIVAIKYRLIVLGLIALILLILTIISVPILAFFLWLSMTKTHRVDKPRKTTAEEWISLPLVLALWLGMQLVFWATRFLASIMHALRSIVTSVERFGAMFGYKKPLQRFGVLLLLIASGLWIYVYVH